MENTVAQLCHWDLEVIQRQKKRKNKEKEQKKYIINVIITMCLTQLTKRFFNSDNMYYNFVIKPKGNY